MNKFESNNSTEKEAFAEKLRYLAKKASEIDSEKEVFGAGTHQYRFLPTVSLEAVKEFENRHHVTLPESFVTFLTMVGNGGAGPYYGIIPLEKLDMHCDNSEDTFLDDTLDAKKWADEMLRLEDEKLPDEEYEKGMRRITNNALVIGTQGCTYDIMLMCGGSEYGKIVYFDWNLEEDMPPFFTHMTFEEWMIHYFEEIIAGNHIYHYGYVKIAEEDVLVKEYLQAQNVGERREIMKSFYRFRTVKKETSAFLYHAVCEDELETDKITVLLRFNYTDGIRYFENQLYSNNPVHAIGCARNIHKEDKAKYYERMKELLYQSGDYDDSQILFYMSECENGKAGDIISYALDRNNDEVSRKIAVYVMGKCDGVENVSAGLAKLMRDESHDVALRALLTAINNELSDAWIKETYLWMKEKYPNDHVIQKQLERVLS